MSLFSSVKWWRPVDQHSATHPQQLPIENRENVLNLTKTSSEKRSVQKCVYVVGLYRAGVGDVGNREREEKKSRQGFFLFSPRIRSIYFSMMIFWFLFFFFAFDYRSSLLAVGLNTIVYTILAFAAATAAVAVPSGMEKKKKKNQQRQQAVVWSSRSSSCNRRASKMF